MRYVNREDLPVEIKNNELPQEDGKSYKMYYDSKIRTNGGFADALFLGAVMFTCFMWGMVIILVMR